VTSARVGSDFYVTQRRRLEKGIADGSANGLLVKPNQNGSLHDTFEVMKLARRHGIELVVSHRSGETLASPTSRSRSAPSASRPAR